MMHRVLRAVLAICLTGMLSATGVGQPASKAQAAPLRQETPTRLIYGQTVDGSLGPEQPSAFFVFTGRAGDTVTVTLIVTGGALDPFLVLNDMARTPLAVDDNGAGGLDARLSYVIPADGDYIIQATHAGGIIPPEGGSYTLNLTAVTETAPPEESATGAVITSNTPLLAPLMTGTTLSDSLTRQTPLRLYWFEGRAGDLLVVMPQQLAEFQPLLALYDSAFREVGRAVPGAALRLLLPDDGVYFLTVALPLTSSLGGTFTLTAELGAGLSVSEDGAIDIEYGASQQGSINDSAPQVTYRFYGSAGDTVTVRMSRAGGDLNCYLYLFTTSGQMLAESSNVTGDGTAEIVYSLPADGSYLIAATRTGAAEGTSSGTFLLELRSDAVPPEIAPASEPVLPPDYAQLPLLAYGDTVQGEITPDKFMDVYVFLGHEGEPITVEMKSLNAGTSATALDPFLVLLDDQRIPLAEHDDIVEGVERDARLEFTLPRTAYYAIVATRFDQAGGNSTGPYSLTLSGPGQRTPATAGEASTSPLARLKATPLISDEPIQAVFESAAALYTFTAFAGSLADIAVTADAGTDILVILADETLNEIRSSNTGALTGIEIPKTGRYAVLVAPRFGPADEPGKGYMIALALAGTTEEGETTAAGGRLLVYGDLVNGAIDDDTTSQTYTFAGLAGETVQITMKASNGSTLDCYLELQTADGTVLEANDDIVAGQVRDSRIVAELPADGTYVIVASRYQGPDAVPTSGTYELLLERVDNKALIGVSPVLVPIAYGQTLSGEISDEQYLLFYVFDGAAGDTVSIQVAHTSGNLDTVLHLYRAEGAQWVEIASNDDSPTGGTFEPMLSRVILPQTGKYLIAVHRYGLDREAGTGTFTVTLTQETP